MVCDKRERRAATDRKTSWTGTSWNPLSVRTPRHIRWIQGACRIGVVPDVTGIRSGCHKDSFLRIVTTLRWCPANRDLVDMTTGPNSIRDGGVHLASARMDGPG